MNVLLSSDFIANFQENFEFFKLIEFFRSRHIRSFSSQTNFITPPLPPEGTAPEGTRRASLALNSRYYECAPKGTAP